MFVGVFDYLFQVYIIEYYSNSFVLLANPNPNNPNPNLYHTTEWMITWKVGSAIDGTKLMCDQVKVVEFSMQDRVTPKEQIFLFIWIQRRHITTPQSQHSDES